MDVKKAVDAYIAMTPAERNAKLDKDEMPTSIGGKMNEGKTARQVMRDKVRDATGITEAERKVLVDKLKAIEPQTDWLWKMPKKL